MKSSFIKVYTPPIVASERIASSMLCASGAPTTGKVTFTLMVSNDKPVEIVL